MIAQRNSQVLSLVLQHTHFKVSSRWGECNAYSDTLEQRLIKCKKSPRYSIQLP